MKEFTNGTLSLNNKNLSRDAVVQPMPLPGYLSIAQKASHSEAPHD
jgi:hypothetical protein